MKEAYVSEVYVSYEVVKLLKEKGFDERTFYHYNKCDVLQHNIVYNQYKNSEMLNACSAPTHQMACAWLREQHNILISIIPQEVKVGIDKLCYAIYRITEDVYTPLYNGFINNLVDSYEDAVEAALKYCLENLI